ncbi:MAG TPA: bifunctional uroporphyrinogen-III C-methyltransferase/uroporphyrinogen-III synthase [Kineosporiaceae bacterium]
MSSPQTRRPSTGEVSFVGAGPGDEGLLTLRAVERLARADVVVLDQLRRDALLARYCRSEVKVVDAGFGEDGLPMTRAARAKLLVRAARPGGFVVRLIDGDSSSFTGMIEELTACRKEGIRFEVVPGVSPATAVPAYAGIPLTPAGTTGVHVVHPHGLDVDWSVHAGAHTTVVVLGAVEDVVDAAAGLIAAGRDPKTPVTVTSRGTTMHQRTASCRLGQVAKAVPAARLERPVVAVVGEAAGLRETGSWFESKPLFGWRVLVPRTKEQAGSMVERLAEFGATAEVVPTISVEPPRTPHQIEKAVKGLVTGRYEWIGFTSVNAVRAIREKFEAFGLDARAFAGLKVAAVGGVTAAALREWGIEPDLVPGGGTEQSASGLLEAWPPYDRALDPINRVFLPRADIATETLVAGLQGLGWEVDDVTAYRTVRAAPPPAEVREAIKTGKFDAVVFTSSSTVRNLVGIAGKPHAATVVACIGPATAKAAQEHGLRVDVLPSEPSSEALVTALAEYGHGLRLSAAEAGEPVLRPSQRRGASRRTAK